MTETVPPPAAAPIEKRDRPAYVFRGEGNGLYQRIAWGIGRAISRVVAMLLFRLRVSGQANLPKTGGVLLVVNHQSFLDPWLMGIAPARQVHYMARDTLFKGGFLHYLMELWNTFPVKRGSADLGAIRNAVDRLDKGFMLTIFPEGTRSEDGSIGTLSGGMTLILNRCKTDVAIVPVVIDGAYDAWPRSAKFPRVGAAASIRIHHGRPIPAAQWRQWSTEELALRVRAELVRMQRAIHSPHAAESERRLAVDAATFAEESGKPGRARRKERRPR